MIYIMRVRRPMKLDFHSQCVLRVFYFSTSRHREMVFTRFFSVYFLYCRFLVLPVVQQQLDRLLFLLRRQRYKWKTQNNKSHLEFLNQ